MRRRAKQCRRNYRAGCGAKQIDLQSRERFSYYLHANCALDEIRRIICGKEHVVAADGLRLAKDTSDPDVCMNRTSVLQAITGSQV
jgi:hypothetical protein